MPKELTYGTFQAASCFSMRRPGALVFLSCPRRVVLRLARLVVGIGLGTVFFRRGFSLGRSAERHTAAEWIFLLLSYADAYDLFTPDAGELAFLADEQTVRNAAG